MMGSARQVTMKRLIGPAVLAGLLLGCSPPPQEQPQPPLHLGVAYDISGSVNQLELPQLTPEDIARMVATLKSRGGSMAFGLVN